MPRRAVDADGLCFAALPDGQVRVQLEPQVVHVLAVALNHLNRLLPDDFAVLRDDRNIHPHLRRVFPVGHASDTDVAADYAHLARPSLGQSQRQAINTIAGTLRPLSTRGEATLKPTQVAAWVRGLNTMRLVYGTQCDVQAAHEVTIDPDGDRDLLCYEVLTVLLGQLVEVIAE